MTILAPSNSHWNDRMLAVFRAVAGLLFVSFGTMKVFGFPHSPMVPAFNPLTEVGIGGLLEVIGGVAIVLGLFTRPVAFVLAGEMAVAYFQFHAPQSFWPSVNMGVPAVMYCFFFLYLTFVGAPAWSIDARLVRSRRA